MYTIVIETSPEEKLNRALRELDFSPGGASTMQRLVPVYNRAFSALRAKLDKRKGKLETLTQGRDRVAEELKLCFETTQREMEEKAQALHDVIRDGDAEVKKIQDEIAVRNPTIGFRTSYGASGSNGKSPEPPTQTRCVGRVTEGLMTHHLSRLTRRVDSQARACECAAAVHRARTGAGELPSTPTILLCVTVSQEAIQFSESELLSDVRKRDELRKEIRKMDEQRRQDVKEFRDALTELTTTSQEMCVAFQCLTRCNC